MTQNQGTKAEARAWPKRRKWLNRIASDPRLTTGAKSLLLLLASRSDDAGKPVWGCQTKLAAQTDTSLRSIGRYVAEAEALGYVTVYRSTPHRGLDGRYCRRRSNSYYLRFPPLASPLEAPRRVKPAGRCVVASHKRRSYLPDTGGRSTPYGERQPARSRPEMAISTVWSPPEAEEAMTSGSAATLFGALRAQLGPRRRR
jgi:hypothetical protein